MFLLERLRKNAEGISLSIPNDIQVIGNSERQLIFHINESLPVFEISKSLFDLDLRSNYQPILLQEIALYARKEFESLFYKEAPQNPKATEAMFYNEPRTKDPNWSPIIKVEISKINNIPALYILRRLTYRPGSEFISSHLIIPTNQGTYEINAHSKAGMTGYRESALYMILLEQNKGVEPEELMKTIDQSYYDDPEKDKMFKEHPLSLLREAHHWLQDEQRGNLKITATAPSYREGEIHLENVGCAVVLPPGYIFSQLLTSAMSKTIAIFVRVILCSGSIGGGKKMIGVWRSTDKDARKINTREGLKKLAIKSTQGWKNEGAKEINVETEDLPDFNGKPQISCYTRFKVGDEATQSLARWFVDSDNYVFRVDVSCVPFFSKEELNQDIEIVLKSWRRLPIVDEPEVTKPWWQFW